MEKDILPRQRDRHLLGYCSDWQFTCFGSGMKGSPIISSVVGLFRFRCEIPFDFPPCALLQTSPQLLYHTVLVPRPRRGRVKGKRVRVPRCPATVTGDESRERPLGCT